MQKTIKRLGVILLAMILMLALPVSTQAARETAKPKGNPPMISAATTSLVVKSDGSLWGWGDNQFGGLGNGTKTDGRPGSTTKKPIKIMSNVLSASAGGNLSVAVKTDNTLWAWGWFGGLGKEYLKPVKIMDNVRSATVTAAYPNDIVVIKTDGSLWALVAGGNPTKLMDNVAAVSSRAGSRYFMAIKTDNSLWACGYNNFGELGDGTRTQRTTPVKVMDNVTAVSVGTDNVLAVKTDGTLWGWGGGQDIGTLVVNSPGKPKKIMENVADVSVGARHAMIIKTDGSLWGWGANGGQIGDGTISLQGMSGASINNDRRKPVKIMDNVAIVCAGDVNTYAIKTDGTLWGWGSDMGADVTTTISSETGKEYTGTGGKWWPDLNGTLVPKKIMEKVKVSY